MEVALAPVAAIARRLLGIEPEEVVKVILVGDALMDMYELMEKRYDSRSGEVRYSGMDQINRFRAHYDHLIWLNPEEPPRWGGYWGESYGYIARAVDMYPLTVDGLERGMKKLLVNR